MVGDRLQGLLHHGRVGDLGVLPQGVDHARRFAAVGALPHGELGGGRGVLQGLVQLHARAHQGVDHLGHLIACHARIARRVDDLFRQLRFFGLVGNVRLDRDVTNDRAIVRADLGRNGHRRRGGHRLANTAFEFLLAFVELLVTFGL